MSEQEITIKFDPDSLARYEDSFLVALWHVAQWNPAPHGDYAAGEIASNIGFEIIRRWLKNAPVEMYHHQQRHNYHQALTKLATYRAPEGVRPNANDRLNAAWHSGTWVVKDETRKEEP